MFGLYEKKIGENKMTNEMEYLMYLFACGAKGKTASPPEKKVDWNKILDLAINQSITYTVAMAIKKSETGCPEELRNRFIAMLRGGAIKNAIKTEGILKLVNKMKDEGIDVIIIKGIDVSRYYANPECRISADTDLLIKPVDEKRAICFLKKEGFFITGRKATDYHSEATHPLLGMVELHIKLLPDIFNLEIFEEGQLEKSAFSEKKQVDYYELPFYGLSATNNIIFLTYHMMKHLMVSGISLGMIMDFSLYSKNNIDRIDKKIYKDMLKNTHYYHTMQLILGLSVKYFGFNENDFPIKPLIQDDEISLILSDLEDGGWQGLNEASKRYDFYKYYLRKRTLHGDQKKKNNFFLGKEYFSFRVSKVFLPMSEMKKSYPLLNQYAFLYFAFSLHRIVSKISVRFSMLILDKKKYNVNEAEFTELNDKRIEMFKKLEIM